MRFLTFTKCFAINVNARKRLLQTVSIYDLHSRPRVFNRLDLTVPSSELPCSHPGACFFFRPGNFTQCNSSNNVPVPKPYLSRHASLVCNLDAFLLFSVATPIASPSQIPNFGYVAEAEPVSTKLDFHDARYNFITYQSRGQFRSGIGIDCQFRSGIGIELELPSLELNWNCHHWNRN